MGATKWTKLLNGLDFRATVDITGAIQALDGVLRQGMTLGKAFRTIKPQLKKDQRDHAKAREGPDAKWPKRTEETMARLRANGKRARRPMGRLLSAVMYKTSAKGVTAVSLVPWSGTHMVGDRVGSGATVPARPFLWISARLYESAMQILTAHLVEKWED